MDVRCPQCQTLYELDEHQLSARAVTLKCSQCQYVFRLTHGDAGTGENDRRWMIRRKAEGDILYLKSFDTLHEWILKRTVRGEDEISRTGERWARLRSIGEFQPMFAVVDSIAALEGELEGRSDVSSIATRRLDTPADTEAVRPRVRTTVQFGGAGTPPRPAPAMRTEDVTQKVGRTGATPPDVDAELAALDAETSPLPPSPAPAPTRAPLVTADISRERPPAAMKPAPSSGIAPWLIGGVLLAGASGTAFWLFQQEGALRRNTDVVTIGTPAPTTAAQPSPQGDPRADVRRAIDASLAAAHAENDAVWTFWHSTASAPFYVALDTAYAEADRASAGVELEIELRDARTALENGRLDQAIRGFRAVLARQPNNAAALSGIGWALLEQGHADEASRQFSAAITMNQDHGDAYIGLGSAHRQLGRLKEAYDAYDLYLGRFPRGPKASIASYQMEQLRKQLGM